MTPAASDSVVSPDGRYLWDGKRWVESPKGTIQKLVWSGENWEKIPPEEGGAIFSPDGQEMWTISGWIAAPPNEDSGHSVDVHAPF